MKRDRENREWLDDYMSLKQVNSTNPFTVPEGYFNELEQKVTSYIKLDELKNPDANQGFAVPPNYFTELSEHIQSRIAVEVALIKAPHGFIVPEGYFTGLEQQIESRIFVEEALNIKSPGFIVPNDYFDNLEKQVESRIFVEETLNQPENKFTVPEGYFNKLNKDILNKTTDQPVRKPKGVVRRMFASPAFKYAMAACLTLSVGSAIFLNQNAAVNPASAHDKTFLHQSLAGISVTDIKSYLQLHLDDSDTRSLMDDGDKQINDEKLSNDLQEYIDTTQ